MSRYVILLICLLAVPFLMPAVSAEDAKADAELQAKIKVLIERLGSDDFDEREAATIALMDIGPPARAQVEEAAKSPDIEINRRAKEILKAVTCGLSHGEYKQVAALVERLRNADPFAFRGKAPDEMWDLREALRPYLPDAAAMVEELLGDENFSTRYSACYILSAFRSKKALQQVDAILNQLSSGGINDSVRAENALRGMIEFLGRYSAEEATPVARKYLRQPYIAGGILRCGKWAKEDYAAFVVLARGGLLANSDVQEYFIKQNNKEIVPLLKEKLKEGKDANGAIVVLGKLTPDDADFKKECVRLVHSVDYSGAANAVLAEIDPAAAAKEFRERIDYYLGLSAADLEMSRSGFTSQLLVLLAKIEGQKSLDVLGKAACHEYYHGSALWLILGFPADVRRPAMERVLANWKGDPCDVLQGLAETKNFYLTRCIISGVSFEEKKDYENALRMALKIDEDNLSADLLKRLPDVANPGAQLSMLGIIAVLGDKKALPDVEKAFKDFAERDAKTLKERHEREFERLDRFGPEQAAPPPNPRPKFNVEKEVGWDLFRLAVYLNMLGKDNAADISDYILKNNFSIPHLVVPAVKNGKVAGINYQYSETIVYAIRRDKNCVLLPRLKEKLKTILAQDYLFNTTAKAPAEPAGIPIPPETPWRHDYWIEWLKVTIALGEKEELQAALSVLQKHVDNPTEMLMKTAEAMNDCDGKAVAAFLVKYFESVRDRRLIDERAWYAACKLAATMTETAIQYPSILTRESRRAVGDGLVASLKRIAEK